MRRHIVALLTLTACSVGLLAISQMSAVAEDKPKDKAAWPEEDPLPAVCESNELDACGGDVTGTWKIVDGCRLEAVDFRRWKGCDASADRKLLVTGTMTFGGEGDLEWKNEMREHNVVKVNCSCLPESARDKLRTSDGKCTKVDRREDSDVEKMKYATKESTIELTQNGRSLEGSYCVKGDRLQIMLADKIGMFLTLERTK